ncbi:MAG: glycosyltransferase family 2 protein [Anaeromyxobacter sp.]
MAAEAGALVLERPWDDDFAAPRNLAAERASGEWILQLDADERLAAGAGKAIREAIRQGGFDVGLVRLHNATRLDAPEAEVLSGALRLGSPNLLPRVIRRAPDLRYEGAVHEDVSEWAARHGNKLRKLPADVVHLGYVDGVQDDRNKRARNEALLRRRMAQEPDSIVPIAYLAIELAGTRRFADAAEVAEQGWALLPSQPPHRSIRRLAVGRALAAVNQGAPARARESVDRAEAHEGPNPDYDFLRGCAWELEATAAPAGAADRAALLERATAAYRKTLDALARGGFPQVLLVTEAEALARLGTALLLAGDAAQARQVFVRARQAGAGDKVVLGEAEACLVGSDPGGALALLQPLMVAGVAAAWALAARAAHDLGAEADARLFLERAKALG